MSTDLTLSAFRARSPLSRATSDCARPRVMHARGAERKSATVMFADLKDSMGLSGSIGMEQWWDVISGLFQLMCDSAYAFGGWVGNFTGDGITAVFEACESPEQHVRRACEAALWLRDRMQDAATELPGGRDLDLTLRIGLNSGEILTGMIGDPHSRYYTVGGYAVALAKRMESLARPGQIYISEHTAALASPEFALRSLGAFEVKGAVAPVCVYELVGPSTGTDDYGGSLAERSHSLAGRLEPQPRAARRRACLSPVPQTAKGDR